MPLAVVDLRQRDNHSCGGVALDVHFRFHGLRLPRMYRALPDPVRGLGPDTAELIVRKHYAHVIAGRLDLATLRHFSRFTPVLCVITVAPESDHWVNCIGVSRTRVHFHCPSDGLQSVPHADWLAMWRDAGPGAYLRYGLTGWPG